MRLLNRLQWRLAVAYTTLTLLAVVSVSLSFTGEPGGGPVRVIITIAVVAALVGVISVALGFLLTRRTAQSLDTLTEGARRLAAGDLDHRVGSMAGDGIGELAGAFNQMAATIRDTVRDLAGEHTKLSAVLDTMADGVVVIDSDGRVTLMNRAAETLLEVGVKQALGNRIIELVRDHELQALVSRASGGGSPQQAELELLHPRRFLSAFATPLSNGASEGVLLALHDLTRMRQIENTRKEFVSNVSHELRSPLASVKAMIETLEGGALADGDVAGDFLRRVHRDVDRMTDIVNDLLELSRLESGQTAIHLAPVDVRSLVEEMVARHGGAKATAGVTVHTDLPDAVPMVVGEEGKLHQVLVNLLENAVRFTPEDGRVTVAAAVAEKFVEISVSDTGVGIAPEDLPHVYERFYKADRARQDGGTGLGLAIVKHIVQAHGGNVHAESRIGVGSTFSFTVPRAS